MLRRLHGELGMSWKEVARRLGRTPKACRTRFWWLRRAGRGQPRESTSRTPGQDMRSCHDCGRPTPDYRCPACRRKWQIKHGVPLDAAARNASGDE